MVFNLKSPLPIGFNISSSTTANFSSTSNGFNGLGSTFNSTSTSNQGSSSPLGDLDEFDIISNRNKIGSSPLPMNNGKDNSRLHV